MNRTLKAIVCALAAAAPLTLAVPSQADSTHIPTGPVTNWTYGWMPSPGGTFTLFESGHTYYGMPAWSRTPLYPIVAFNNSLNDAPKGVGTFRVPRNRLVLVPGQAGELAVVRWTADAAGRYLVQGLFDGVDTCVSSNVHILKGSVSLFTTSVAGPQRRPFSFEVSMHRNETLDFAVDYGDDSSIHCDVVGLSAMLSLLY